MLYRGHALGLHIVDGTYMPFVELPSGGCTTNGLRYSYFVDALLKGLEIIDRNVQYDNKVKEERNRKTKI
jgi:hypothetical protein